MAKETKTKTNKSEETKVLTLKPQHAESTLQYNGVDYNLAYATQEQLQVLFDAPENLWKYLFNE